ncbi:MAG: ferredoxin--NADP reductase [Gammaproteobacteria bacterium]|nr:ferredoxin--NADP reductase [Gammaproteobacteria bacterium]
MSNWIDAEVIENIHWTDTLYSLRVKGDIGDYEAGQFGRLGLMIDDQIVGRPYSFVSAPHEDNYEFYSISIEEGILSPLLAKLKAGDHIYLGKKANGFLVLNEIPDSDDLWMISTGTGIGPFLSILKTEILWQRFKKCVLVHAVRTSQELTYQELINDIKQKHSDQFEYVPFVSREKTEFALPGRIPIAIDNGCLEERANLKIENGKSQIMLCGNPHMVKDVRETLEKRGLTKNLRRTPGSISTENYW